MFPRSFLPLYFTPISYWPWASGVTSGTYAHRIPFVPTEAARGTIWDDGGVIIRGEGCNFLFYPTAPGTTSPEAPTALDLATEWKIIVEGFGLSTALEYSSANGKLYVDTTIGTVMAGITAAETATFAPMTFGTVSLWRLAPTDDEIVLIRRARKRAKS